MPTHSIDLRDPITFPLLEKIDRRTLLRQGAALCAAGLTTGRLSAGETSKTTGKTVRTVLGPVAAEKLGVTLMHEHAPIVDWSELYEAPVGPIETIRKTMIAGTAEYLDKFHQTATEFGEAGAIVECTPIRTGRYPYLMVELAKRTPVKIIACTGFWCEAAAPMHPWAVKLAGERDGVKRIADLYIREITEGMEDPSGQWGEIFTDIKAGIIKCATSEFLRPLERRCHEAAAIASRQTGCPITTHTSRGGGLEEAQVLLKNGADAAKICIGHQGDKDDRKTGEANEYHRQIAALGCNVQFDRVGLSGSYSAEKIARQIKHLVDAGHVRQILVGHDLVPYFYEDYTAEKKSIEGWKPEHCDFTIITTKLTKALADLGVSQQDVKSILVDNPRRVLAF